MTEPEAEQTEQTEWTCDFGKCEQAHPMHCCHFVVTEWIPHTRKGHSLRGWKCLHCPKTSKAWVVMKDPQYRGRDI